MMIGTNDKLDTGGFYGMALPLCPSVLNGELAPGTKGEGMPSRHEDETLRLSGEKSSYANHV
jgi:hypothetical protein